MITLKLLHAILRSDFKSFIHKSFSTINPKTTFNNNWHIDMIADYLEEVRNGSIKRLIINIPPRNLKSICISVALPAWLLGHNPATRIIVACYSQLLSIKHSIDTRCILESKWYRRVFPQTIIQKGLNQKVKFVTTKHGFRYSTSIGGTLTGEGADIIIIDDPHNPTYIHSTKLRNKVIEWYEKTLISRLNNPDTGAIIVVMQRLHEEDLCGYLMNAENRWTVVKIPIVANCNYIYNVGNKRYFFEKDTILDKGRYSQKSIESLNSQLGNGNFSAQYMQNPIGRNVFLQKSDICVYKDLPKAEFIVQSWDTAIKTSDQSDYSVCTIWAIYKEQYYCVEIYRKKVDYVTLKKDAIQLIHKWNPKYILIEDKSSGQSLLSDLGMQFFNLVGIKPKQDKVTRFASIVELFLDQRVFFSTKIANDNPIMDEITTFPYSRHDDVVDSISQLLCYFKDKKQIVVPNIRHIF